MTEPRTRTSPVGDSIPAELVAGGEMGALIRAYNWSSSPLGRLSDWPQSLRTAVGIMLDSRHPMFLAWGPSLIFLFNDAYRPILGDKVNHALGTPFNELWWEIWHQVGPMADRALAGDSVWFENQKLIMQRKGYPEEAYFNFSYSPIRDESGKVGGMFCACTETTEIVLTTRQLRRTEAELRQANEALQLEREEVQAANRRLTTETVHLRRLFEQAPGFIATLRGPNHVFELANAAYLQLIGNRQVVGKAVREVLSEIEGQGIFELLDQVYRTGEAFVGSQLPVDVRRSVDGPVERRFLDFVYQPIVGADGRVSGIFVEGSDVTERVLAEQKLRRLTETLEEQVEARSRELREAEDALRQAQKMEAVGQLTGGIAHDFNNLILGINGSLSLAERRIAAGRADEAGRFINLAMNSANRAAALTHRLLAFSRRQPLDPKPVDIGRLVGSIEDLMGRTIGEKIELVFQFAPDLWLTLCDPNQLESAILNLVINARDAMPEGGRLTIAASNAEFGAADAARHAYIKPGRYVCLSVNDNGTGMSDDVKARALEPFFTTKPLGQGTGLGLSMIYGFARQSNGFVRIDSQLGHGPTVELCLPGSESAGDTEAPPADAPEAHQASGSHTVLVVEDQATVRELVVEMLRGLGYRILVAQDGPGGLKILNSPVEVDLLVTDIGLPGLNGRQLADAARLRRPDLRVLFMTGYAETAAVAGGFLEPGMKLITKPFSIDALTRRVREMIGD